MNTTHLGIILCWIIIVLAFMWTMARGPRKSRYMLAAGLVAAFVLAILI